MSATVSLSTAQTLAGASVASATAGILSWTWPFTVIGVPASVLSMALLGTAAGLLCNRPGGNRARLFGLAFAYTAVAASAAMVLGVIPGFTFFKAVAPATALLLAFFAHTLIPVVKDALAQRLKRSIGGGE